MSDADWLVFFRLQILSCGLTKQLLLQNSLNCCWGHLYALQHLDYLFLISLLWLDYAIFNHVLFCMINICCMYWWYRQLECPDLKFSGPDKLGRKEYFEHLRNAKFCLAPRGESSWTLRFYESYFVVRISPSLFKCICLFPLIYW